MCEGVAYKTHQYRPKFDSNMLKRLTGNNMVMVMMMLIKREKNDKIRGAMMAEGMRETN